MSIFDPTPAEQAALQERLRLLHESAANGAGVTPMQALDERIAQGDAAAQALKNMILTRTFSVSSQCEKEPKITRAVLLEAAKVTFRSATIHAPKTTFRARH